MTVMAAWLERKDGAVAGKRWCATYKRTLEYQDHVRTRCGMQITLPCGLQTLETLRGPDLRTDQLCPDCMRKVAGP